MQAFGVLFVTLDYLRLSEQLNEEDGGAFIKATVHRMSTHDEEAKAGLDKAMNRWSGFAVWMSYFFSAA